MRIQEFELQGGLTFSLPVTETVEEYDKLAGRPGACHDDAVSNTMYRGPFAKVREITAQRVEKTDGAPPRLTKPHSNKDRAAKGETVYNEAPGAYLARAAAELDQEVIEFQPIVTAFMAENSALPDTDPKKIKFDPSVQVGGPMEPGKKDVENAKVILMAVKDAPEKLQAVLDKITAVMGRPVTLDTSKEDGEVLRALAFVMRDYRQQLSKASTLLS